MAGRSDADPIVITGASGLLGANLVLSAAEHGRQVYATYFRYKMRSAYANWVQLDLTDSAAVQIFLRRCRPRWIVHCAAITNVDWCQRNPAQAYKFNSEASRNLAATAKDIGSGIVYISTDSVFDGNSRSFAERDLPNPTNVYAASKLAGETAVQEEAESSLVLRTNIYGWNVQEKQSLAEWVIDKLEAGQTVPGFADVVFSPILANDLSEVILDMIALRLRGVYHVGGSEACSKYEFARHVAEVFGFDAALVHPTEVAGSGLGAPRPLNTSLNTDKVSRALNRPMPNTKSGIHRFKELRDTGYVENLRNLRGNT